eukprot:m.16389 g.16389  ORF g.16389 m.16389 type:complete len:614 (+) comp3494_c0_seq1:324-2165(+)
MSNATTASPIPLGSSDFSVSDSDIAALTVIGLLLLIAIVAVNAWFYGVGDVDYLSSNSGESRRRYVLAVRVVQFVFSAVVLGLLNEDGVSEPCFFGYDRLGQPSEEACELGFALGCMTLLFSLASLAVVVLWPEIIPKSAVIVDFALTLALTILWFAAGCAHAIFLARRSDRCEVAACDPGSAYEFAIAIVMFDFLLFLLFAMSLPDSFLALGVEMRSVEDWQQCLRETIWRAAELFLLNLMCLATLSTSKITDGSFCWFGRDSCVLDGLGDTSVCQFAISVPSISILVHTGYLISTATNTMPPLEWLTAPLMSVLWVVYASIMSVERGIVCESFVDGEDSCEEISGYSEATAGVVLAWFSAMSATAYAIWALSQRYHNFVVQFRISIGSSFPRRMFLFLLASLLSLLVFALVSRQLNEDDNDLCFYGRDNCGGDYKSACAMAVGVGVIGLIGGIAGAVALYLDTEEEVPVVVVILCPILLFLWLGHSIISSYSESITARNFEERELQGYKLAITALVLSWAATVIWFFICLDVLVDKVYINSNERAHAGAGLEYDNTGGMDFANTSSTSVLNPQDSFAEPPANETGGQGYHNLPPPSYANIHHDYEPVTASV